MKLFTNLLLLLLILRCTNSKEGEIVYSYNVQYVHFEFDEIEEKGKIDADGAIKAFHSFPFKEQQIKAQSLTSPTFPTISFRSHSDEAVLAIWSLYPDHYEIYLEANNKKVTVGTDDIPLIEKTIKDYFSGSRKDLFEMLSEQPSAVVVTNLPRD